MIDILGAKEKTTPKLTNVVESCFYRLVINLGSQKYYVSDYAGTLSRNCLDGLIFWTEEEALYHQGRFENFWESIISKPSDVDIEKVSIKEISCRV